MPTKRPINYKKAPKIVQKMKEGLNSVYRRGMKERWAQTRFLQEIEHVCKGNYVTTSPEMWNQLPDKDQLYLMGYWGALLEAVMQSTTFMYNIRGKWYTPREVTDGVNGLTHKDIDQSLDHDLKPCGNGHYVHTWTDENDQTRHSIYY